MEEFEDIAIIRNEKLSRDSFCNKSIRKTLKNRTWTLK